MYQTDWLMFQIELMVRGIVKLLFNKDTSVIYEIIDEMNYTETDLLYERLKELLADLKINEAENLLFDNIDLDDKNYLLVAIDFYMQLNAFDDDTLEDNNFSRDEIYSGLSEIKEMYGIYF